jgi:tetratricopeptide (TPR) repeat protein
MRGGGAARRRAGVVLLGPALVLAGCAYFNTFYSAKQAFARAQKIERESKTDRLSPEAVKQYDKAIEKSAKVILEHGGGWRAGIDDALFLMGASYYGKREYETAIGKFNELVLNYPKSDHVPEALFYTGLCYQRLRNYEIARQVFGNLLGRYPDFPRRDEILAITAEGRETAGDRAGALVLYRRLAEEFPKSLERERALRRIGEIHFEAGRFDSALIAYQALARYARRDETYFEAQLSSGACLVRLGRPEEALGTYRRILPDDPERSENGARVWLAMGEAENRAGRYDEALEHFRRVAEKFANQGPGVEALFRIGYTEEVHRKDYQKAREAYEKALEGRSTSVFRDQAARRLENLARVQELAAADTARDVSVEQLADAGLKVAEFTLIDGRDPARALGEYRGVLRQYPDSRAALRAAYSCAWILYHDLDSAQAAGRVLFEIVRDHPESPQARGAVDLLAEMGADSLWLAPLRARVAAAEAAAPPDTVAPPAAAPTDTLAQPAPAPTDSLAHAPLSSPLIEGRRRPAFDALPPDSADRFAPRRPGDDAPPRDGKGRE